MDLQDVQTALARQGADLQAAFRSALSLWADATTDATTRRRDELLRGKPKVVEDFFAFVEKHPGEVSPEDVKRWQRRLEEDAQAARDQVIMETGGKVIIASVFDGHLHEPDSVIFRVEREGERDEQEAESVPV